jgi:aldehyde dehydrogenase (NAD+)
VVFEDADMDALLPVVVNAIVQNAGQTCSAGSRLLVQRGAYEQVLERLSGLFSQLRVGSSQMDLDCGPLIRKTQQERVAGFLADARRDGIALVAQGEIAPGAPAGGFYQAPALLRDVPPRTGWRRKRCSARCWQPCPSRMKPRPSPWPTAPTTAWWPASGPATAAASCAWRAIRSGQVFINNYGAGGGVELPFGGVKASGHGAKGFEALYGFTVLKTIAIRHG